MSSLCKKGRLFEVKAKVDRSILLRIDFVLRTWTKKLR